MALIRIPAQLRIEHCNEVFTQYWYAIRAAEKTIEFDLSSVYFVQPSGIGLLSSLILTAITKFRTAVSYRDSRDSKVKTYLHDIGFYHLFKLNSGEEYRPRSTSVPLKHLTRVDYQYLDNLYYFLSKNLRFSENLWEDIKTSILEVINNVFDHSSSSFGCILCAQIYPRRKGLEISIADGGVGIHTTISSVYPRYSTATQSIIASTEEGITCKPRTHRNAGMGLFILKDYIRANLGQLTIISNGGWTSFMEVHVQGTCPSIIRGR